MCSPLGQLPQRMSRRPNRGGGRTRYRRHDDQHRRQFAQLALVPQLRRGRRQFHPALVKEFNSAGAGRTVEGSPALAGHFGALRNALAGVRRSAKRSARGDGRIRQGPARPSGRAGFGRWRRFRPPWPAAPPVARTVSVRHILACGVVRIGQSSTTGGQSLAARCRSRPNNNMRCRAINCCCAGHSAAQRIDVRDVVDAAQGVVAVPGEGYRVVAIAARPGNTRHG